MAVSGADLAHRLLAPGRGAVVLFVPPLCVAILLWPALWNGYPIVFADTGTYLSQAMHRYLGWDRPVFYSLFILPLHLGLTTWPVIVVQSCLTVFVLDLVRRAFEVSCWWLLGLTVFLAVMSWMPWVVCDLTPDVFTPLAVLLLGLLVFSRSRFRPWQLAALTLLAAFMIATQQSSVPLALGLLAVVIPIQLVVDKPLMRVALAPALAPGLAVLGLLLVNVAGYGRVSLSPFGNVFVLARVIYDGPGMDVLRRDCPESGWRLCPYLENFPATVDDFLWGKDNPIILAGGHKAVSADADAIIRAAVIAEPGRLIAAAYDNMILQLTRFASGDGLANWQSQVAPWIDRDFPPRESEAFHAARQQIGTLSVPPPWALLHRAVALAGIAVALILLPAAWNRRPVAARFLFVSLLTLPVSAAVTGGLSAPHDRYQSRIIWLPTAMALLTVPVLWRGLLLRPPLESDRLRLVGLGHESPSQAEYPPA